MALSVARRTQLDSIVVGITQFVELLLLCAYLYNLLNAAILDSGDLIDRMVASRTSSFVVNAAVIRYLL